MKLYESAADRARLLYRIPAVPGTKRTLELYHSDPPLHPHCESAVRPLTLCRIGSRNQTETEANLVSTNKMQADVHVGCHEALPFPDGSFDMVILHRTLDELAASQIAGQRSFEPSVFLKHIKAALSPGGVVAGCVTNRWALSAMRAKLRPFAARAQDQRQPGHYSLAGVRKSLITAGFSGVRVFTLLPNCAAPSKLIDTDPAISRIAFRNELHIARHRKATSSYFARVAMVELGMNRYLEEAFFFWAVKPC